MKSKSAEDVRIRLQPLGATIRADRGTLLQDVLFPYGVEFPCGGRGQCKGCRVKVLEGTLPITPEQSRMLSARELEAGWRLSCQCRAESDLTLELAQWEAAILSDNAPFPFSPHEGLGIAVDLGTTTVVAQLLDLPTAGVLAVKTALNRQAKHGADVMSRIGYAVAHGGLLTDVIRAQVGGMIQDLLEDARADASAVRQVVLVGNSAMHHLFCGVDATPLSRYPFEPVDDGLKDFTPGDLDWTLPAGPRISFLPCLGGFVGSDILAGILATDIHHSATPACLIDLGTNGEVVIGSSAGLVCCSTAAGPAFEGARIYMGMRAATGAIAEVHLEAGRLVCKVLGDSKPRGVCGSGLVDAAAVLLETGAVLPSGRFAAGEKSLMLAEPVRLSQTDIRELQLAKGAIAAGIRILLEETGIRAGDLGTIFLAGAFGNYINRASARRIGLIGFPPERVVPAGNTALRGAKWALYEDPGKLSEVARRVRHISLHARPDFQEIYVEEMRFPEKGMKNEEFFILH